MSRDAGRSRRSRAAVEWLLGPVSPPELTAVLAGAVTGAGVAMATPVSWSRRLVLGCLGFDLAGGLVAFHTPTTRAAYASRARGLPADLAFPAAHVQPLVVAALTGSGWRWGVAQWLGVLAASALVRSRPGPSRRAAGWALVATATTADRWIGRRRPRGRPPAWVTPVLWAKLVAGEATCGPSPAAAPPTPGP